MRTQPVEKRTDAQGRFAPAVDRHRFASRRRAAREAGLDRGALDLADALVVADAAACDAGVDRALELFGHAFDAQRVVFHGRRLDEAEPVRLRPVRVWTPTEGVVDAADGEPPLPATATRERRPTGVEVAAADRPCARDRLVVEVPGAGSPVAAFVIEGGFSAERWSGRLVDRAGLVGRLLGSAFDRVRLAREADATHARQAQSQRLESVGRVATAVAHDFNNVLTAIQGYTDLLEMELGDRPVGMEELSEIRQAAERAAGLVDQMLRFGRQRASKVESLDLIATLKGFEGLLARVLGRGIDFTIACEADLPPVRLDAGRFEPVAMNLASNARDAIRRRPGAGRFSFEARSVTIGSGGREKGTASTVRDLEPGDYVRLTARDDGCGIDPAIRDRVLEPWFTTKPEGEGTGLGLASLAAFQRASHGGVRIESELGGGTAVHLYYPVASPDAD